MTYRVCNTAESDIGMRYYLTDVDGIGGRLKAEPEDFVVREISDRPEPCDDGKYVIVDVTSRNWETNRLMRLLSRSLRISRECVGIAGTKDKRAITTQLMSFKCSIGDLDNVDFKDVSFKDPYRARRGISIGDLFGNEFEIRVTESESSKEETQGVLDVVTSEIGRIGGFPNYFGVQRFGTIRPVTHKVGEAIVRGDIEGAVMTYLSAFSDFEDDATKEARVSMLNPSNWPDVISSIPDSLAFEKMMMDHLIANPDDWAGAITKLPGNLQMMFTHAYQSYLFNMMLSERMSRGLPLNMPVAGDEVIPLDSNGIPLHESPVEVTERNIDLVSRQVKMRKAYVAFPLYGSESRVAKGEIGEIQSKVLESEGIANKDFIVPGIPKCNSKGNMRELICPVSNLGHEVEEGGCRLSFSLPKGNYATCLLREVMKSEMNRY